MERPKRKLLSTPSRGELKVVPPTRRAFSSKSNPVVDRWLKSRRHERAKYRP